MFAFRRALASASRSGKNLAGFRQKHTLPNLPYEYCSLEPVISCEIMQLHHLKHHQAYVNGLNETEEKIKEALMKGDFAQVISLNNALKFHGGGHINHSIFWGNMSPNNEQPTTALLEAVCKEFGGLDRLMEEMSKVAVGVQGSGWAWLGLDKKSNLLKLATCANQDPLQATTGLVPLLGIDVWEHAYYLQYKNARAEYVKKFWDIVNWENVSERYTKAITTNF